jgi:hypothetical protein
MPRQKESPGRKESPVIAKNLVIHLPKDEEINDAGVPQPAHHAARSAIFAVELRFKDLAIEGLPKDREQLLRTLLGGKLMYYEIAAEKGDQFTYMVTLGGIGKRELHADSEAKLLAAAEQFLRDELTYRLTMYVRGFDSSGKSKLGGR